VNAESRADPLLSLYKEIMQMPDLYCVFFLKKKINSNEQAYQIQISHQC
jgi:hypothetical protein